MPSLVFRAVQAAFYDGSSNSADDCLLACQEITANTATWTIHSDDGTTLVIREQVGPSFADWPVDVDTWLVVAPDFGIIARITDPVFQQDYRQLSQVLSLMDIDTELANDPTFLAAVAESQEVTEAIQSAVTSSGAFGVSPVPTLLLASQTTVQVAIRPGLPDTSYTATAFLSPGNVVLANLAIISVTKVSGSRVDVVVRNNGLVTLDGALVFVHCD